MLKNSFEKPSTAVKHTNPDWLDVGPFDASNSVVRFYAGGGRGELLDCIIKHVQNSHEPLFIHGESGSGKTLMSLLLGHKLSHRYHVVHCQQPDLNVEQLIQYLFEQLCPLDAERLIASLSAYPSTSELQSEYPPEYPPVTTPAISFEQLQSCLLERRYNDRSVVLIVDAGLVLDESLTTLLKQLGQMTLAGQPMIQSVVFEPTEATSDDWSEDNFDPVPGLSHYTLRRLTLNEVHGFLHHHMLLFDYSQQHLFNREMACLIAEKAGGLIGSVNTIAREAWMLASIHNDGPVAMKHLVAVTGTARREPERVSVYQKIKTQLSQLIRSGGFGLAIFIMSVVVLMATWRLTS